MLTKPDTTHCQIPVNELMEHFFPVSGSDGEPSVFHRNTRCPDAPATNSFSTSEVLTKLKACENTAPGPDRLTYKHWLGVDPEAKALTLIYNICLKCSKVPKTWKESRTILIPKTSDPTSPSDWRPISLCSTISKLYSGLLTRRLSNWIEANDILSHCQKGFRPFDGTFEHTFAIEQRIQEARASGTDICLLSIDFANAFGSASHSLITEALSSAGAGDKFTSIITDLYTEQSTRLYTADGESEPIPIRTGIKQGDPLSGLLFNLLIDPILRSVQGDCEQYRVLGFCDDISLISNCADSLQASLDVACETARKVGLSVNPTKCHSPHSWQNAGLCSFNIQDQR